MTDFEKLRLNIKKNIESYLLIDVDMGELELHDRAIIVKALEAVLVLMDKIEGKK